MNIPLSIGLLDFGPDLTTVLAYSDIMQMKAQDMALQKDNEPVTAGTIAAMGRPNEAHKPQGDRQIDLVNWLIYLFIYYLFILLNIKSVI